MKREWRVPEGSSQLLLPDKLADVSTDRAVEGAAPGCWEPGKPLGSPFAFR